MELINTEAAKLKELTYNTTTLFKQEPKLMAAIDKFVNATQVNLNMDRECSIRLPERKLNFYEVQQLLQQSIIHIKEKPADLILKEINDARKMIINKIEDILNLINITAENGGVPKLCIRNQRLWSNCIYDLDRVTLKTIRDAKKTTLNYSSNEDKSRFNAIVFVLTKVHELLSKKLTITRREMFYQNISRFRNQANLDIAVRDVCCLLETPPWSLGIVATAKGLIAGPLTMHYHDGNIIDCMVSGGVLIPQDINGLKEFQSTAKYILVVEKDAVFQKLLDEGALVRLGPVIIITGKGYPDVCTRQLLCRLCNELNLKALALIDADPHGFEIFLTYKYGSLAQSHLSSSLACSSLLLLGVRHHDVMTLAPNEARLPLSDLDKRKLVNLIRRPYLGNTVGLLIREELNAMLTSGIKAEIEAVAPYSGALCDAYLPSKIILSNYLVSTTGCAIHILPHINDKIRKLDMENHVETNNDKKSMNKAKSYSNGLPKAVRNESVKRKSYSVNEAMRSLDLALGRLKKSKLVSGECCTSIAMNSARLEGTGMYMDIDHSPNMSHGLDNASLMSMNFSHYELIRNLSCSNHSDGAFSGSTCNTELNPADSTIKDEHLERYFRSAEMWTQSNCGNTGPSSVQFEIPDN